MHDDDALSARADASPEQQAVAARSTGEWFQALYHELRRRARGELFRHQVLTMGATTLLHEPWLPIDSPPLESATQGELVARAGRTMRGIVIEHIRARQVDKHDGAAVSAPHEALIDLDSLPDREVLVLNDALAALARAEPPLAELVELKFFAGLNLAEIAALRETSESTVQHDWERARLFLFAAIRE